MNGQNALTLNADHKSAGTPIIPKAHKTQATAIAGFSHLFSSLFPVHTVNAISNAVTNKNTMTTHYSHAR